MSTGVPLHCLRQGAEIRLVRKVIYARREAAAEREGVKKIISVQYNSRTQRVVLRLTGVKGMVGGGVKDGQIYSLTGGSTGKRLFYEVVDVTPCERGPCRGVSRSRRSC